VERVGVVNQSIGGSVAPLASPFVGGNANGSYDGFYVGTDGSVRIWLWSGTSWVDQDLGGEAAVWAAPMFTSTASTTFIKNNANAATVTASGYPIPSFTESGALPTGVTFQDNGNGSGALTGPPAAGTGGSYPLTITASNGVVPDASQSFTLTVVPAPAPTITALLPASGPTSGGNTVTITGTGFTGANQVLFGYVPGTHLSVVNSSAITVSAPAQAAATHNVYVTTPSGTSAQVTADQYTYL
jgi:hypothetical protein